MFKKLSSLIVAVVFMPSAAAQEKVDRADAQAREVVEQFMNAMRAENADAVLRVADVPFFWDGKMIIKNRDELKKELVRTFESKDLTQIEYEIKETQTLAKVQGTLRENDLKQLNEVLEEDDRIVLVTLKLQGQQEGLAVMVRMSGAKPKVAGFRD